MKNLDLPRRIIYAQTYNPIDRNWTNVISEAADQAIETYAKIVSIDSKRTNPVLTRHLGIFAIIDRTIDGPWDERVRSIVQFGSQEGLNKDENYSLFVAKALQRAVLAENHQEVSSLDSTPAYLGLGKTQEAFSTGIAGPYPFHSQLVHDTFHNNMMNLYQGLPAFSTAFDAASIAKIEAGFLGGNNGDSGDNTPELDLARQPFMEFAEKILAS